MTPSAARMAVLVRWGQAVYLVLLALCVVLDPAVATHRDEGGISNFGIHTATAVPYTLAFAGAAALLALAAAATPRGDPLAARFKLALRALAVALVCVLASTYAYRHAAWLHALHIVVATAAVVLEVVVACWTVARLERDATGIAALSVLVLGAALAAVTLAGAAELLFVAQAVTSIAFAVLLVRGASAVAARFGAP